MLKFAMAKVYGLGFTSNRLTWDELIPVCSPTLLDGQLPPAEPSELSNYTLLHVIGYEEGWGFWLNQLGYLQYRPFSGHSL